MYSDVRGLVFSSQSQLKTLDRILLWMERVATAVIAKSRHKAPKPLCDMIAFLFFLSLLFIYVGAMKTLRMEQLETLEQHSFCFYRDLVRLMQKATYSWADSDAFGHGLSQALMHQAANSISNCDDSVKFSSSEDSTLFPMPYTPTRLLPPTECVCMSEWISACVDLDSKICHDEPSQCLKSLYSCCFLLSEFDWIIQGFYHFDRTEVFIGVGLCLWHLHSSSELSEGSSTNQPILTERRRRRQ